MEDLQLSKEFEEATVAIRSDILQNPSKYKQAGEWLDQYCDDDYCWNKVLKFSKQIIGLFFHTTGNGADFMLPDDNYRKEMCKIFTICALLFATVGQSKAEVLYNITDLGTLGGSRSNADSLNENGQIVGYAINSYNQQLACLFDSTGGGNNIDLGTLGGTRSWAESINDNGVIVGAAAISSSSPHHSCRFDLTGNGDNIDLGTLGGFSSTARSINNNGQIIGSAQGSNSNHHAYTFNFSGGGGTDLGTLGGSYSGAYAINNSGQIVGQARGDAYDRACLFDSTGGGNNIDLGTIPGGYNTSWATGINDNSQVIGCVRHNFDPKLAACLFDSSGSGNNIALQGLGGNWDAALSINNKGQIAGQSDDTSNVSRAVLWDSDSITCIDLNTLVESDSGWFLQAANDINNNGWIVGFGDNPDGDSHAFLLTPVPEPASILMLAIGSIILRKRETGS